MVKTQFLQLLHYKSNQVLKELFIIEHIKICNFDANFKTKRFSFLQIKTIESYHLSRMR